MEREVLKDQLSIPATMETEVLRDQLSIPVTMETEVLGELQEKESNSTNPAEVTI